MPKPDGTNKVYPEVRVGLMVPSVVAEWVRDEARKSNEQPVLFLRRMILDLYKAANPVAPPVSPMLEVTDKKGNKITNLIQNTHPGIE